MSLYQGLGCGFGIIQSVGHSPGGNGDGGYTEGARMGVGGAAVGGGPAIGGKPSRIVVHLPIDIGLGQADTGTVGTSRGVHNTTSLNQGDRGRSSQKGGSIVRVSDLDSTRDADTDLCAHSITVGICHQPGDGSAIATAAQGRVLIGTGKSY